MITLDMTNRALLRLIGSDICPEAHRWLVDQPLDSTLRDLLAANDNPYWIEWALWAIYNHTDELVGLHTTIHALLTSMEMDVKLLFRQYPDSELRRIQMKSCAAETVKQMTAVILAYFDKE